MAANPVHVNFAVLQQHLAGLGTPVTRFAPSPTGYLHLGHIAHALYVWGIAQALKATIVLRFEGHDRQRCRRSYEEAIVEDLEWLGLLSDHNDVKLGNASTLFARQSDHLQRYEKACHDLKAQGRLYACRCSRKDIARSQTPLLPRSGGLHYQGSCRNLGLAYADGMSLRFKLDPHRVEHFYDHLQGEVNQVPYNQGGDFNVIDKRGNYTYQLAVVVDDLEDKVNLIIRGQDILPSTGRQEALRQALATTVPPRLTYLHHPLLTEAHSQTKLSKRQRSASISSMRAAGESPSRILGWAAYELGLISRPQSLEVRDFSTILAASP